MFCVVAWRMVFCRHREHTYADRLVRGAAVKLCRLVRVRCGRKKTSISMFATMDGV